MAEKRLKITASMVAADKQLKQELGTLNAGCPKLIFQENKQLSDDLSLINNLIAYSGMDRWMTIWSVIENLTDGTECEKLTEDTNPESKFRKNPVAVHRLRICLEHWLDEGLILYSTTLKGASVILTERLEENVILLKL
jgi:hypothetical protein